MSDYVGVEDIKRAVAEEEPTYKALLSDYPDAATQYAYDVLFTDTYITGQDTQLGCIRHLNDLLRQGDEDFPYIYNLDMVNAIEYFARTIPDPTDIHTLINPMPWQSFILDNLIGWRDPVHKGSRFHTGIVSIARQQGKTWLASILVNFSYFVIGLQASSQDFLVASYDNEHAKKLFDYVSLQAQVILKSPDFKEDAAKQGVEAQTRQVIGHKNKNTIRIGSAQAGGFDSYHNLIAVFDEIGNLQPKMNESVNQIISGQSKISNRLFLEISTAYPNVKVKFKNDQDVMRKIVRQDSLRDAEDTFMMIYSQDNDSEVFSPELWEKSNPLLGHPELKDQLLDGLIKLRDKQEREGELASFVNKSLNVWSRRFQNSFISLENIKNNIIDGFDVDNREVYVGFDASQTNDNTSFGLIYPYQVGKSNRFYAQQYSFIPFAAAKSIGAKEKQDGLNYRQLAERHLCEVTRNPAGTINQQQVYQWLVEYVSQHQLKIKAVVADPNLAAWFVKMVENYQPEWPLLTLAPTSYKLSVPTKEFQTQFINGNIKMIDDPLMTDGLNNAVLVEDRGGAIKIDRQNWVSEHIDTTDALINAYSQAMDYFKGYRPDEGYNPLNNLNHSERADFFKAMFGG
ncbi:terminase TerL endonuclease subunit [Lactiplantibacillus plantarum]|uniref:terminase TerL endonuclease subunit n=1 Tax=Lactiplantibacillus plantarum TaxID=1590 RepID=UPI001F4D0836|nr:terminase large subunit [Lactiplantibacillus plantarum]MCH8635336.1 terminase large subunit [Lactiplantibacillus plantarum]